MNTGKTINSFMGKGEFYWWTGVVEDINDPLKLGRVRVRILGLHSELRMPDDQSGEGIKVSDLPWAIPLQSITNAAMNGIGTSPTGIVQGSWAIGFSRDGEACQDLIVMGTLGGIPQEIAQNTGFNDPNLTYPKSTHIGEPDTNRLARNESIEETVVQSKKDNLDTGVGIANGGSWSEPATPYAAKYPKNHVHESESGHIEEVDDTPGAERTHRYHKSGTFEEVYPDGTKVVKVVGKDYEIIASDKNVHIKGVCNITVDGNAAIKVGGDMDVEVDGNVNAKVAGTMEAESGGDAKVTAPKITTVGQTVLDEGSGNIVTTEHICAFTGMPHIEGSSTCKAKK